jgi:hypothetical protein
MCDILNRAKRVFIFDPEVALISAKAAHLFGAEDNR